MVFIPLGYFISIVTEVRGYANDSLKWCKLSSQNDRCRTNFEDKLADDEKYFLISNGKDEFDKLSNKQIRSLANFYTNFYIKPAGYNKSDEKFADTLYRMYDEHIKFNDELEVTTKHLFGVLISGLVLASISLIIFLTIFCKCLNRFRSEYSTKVYFASLWGNAYQNDINNQISNIASNRPTGDIGNKGGSIDQASEIIKNRDQTVKKFEISSDAYKNLKNDYHDNFTLNDLKQKGLIPNEFKEFKAEDGWKVLYIIDLDNGGGLIAISIED